MTVSALVVKPRFRITVSRALAFVRGTVSQIKPRALPKLRRRVFRQIVPKSLPQNPDFRAVRNHLMTMLCNCPKMLYSLFERHKNSILFLPINVAEYRSEVLVEEQREQRRYQAFHKRKRHIEYQQTLRDICYIRVDFLVHSDDCLG